MWKERLVKGKFAGPSQSMRIGVPLGYSTISSKHASKRTPERQRQHQSRACECGSCIMNKVKQGVSVSEPASPE